MRKLRVGDYTIYRDDSGVMGNDLLVRTNPSRGAEIIVLCSLFMDYGHVLKVFNITEEQYFELENLNNFDALNEWLQRVWPNESQSS